MKRFAFFIPIVIFGGITLLFLIGLSRDPGYLPSMLINKPAPEFALKSEIPGSEDLSTDALKGQISLINVFGSWCSSCVIEHPILMRISAEQSVAVYGLNWRDQPDDAAVWLRRYGNPYAKIGHDQTGRVAIDFGVTGAPETFIIDAEGRVRHKHVGPISWETWTNVLLPMIEDLKRNAASS